MTIDRPQPLFLGFTLKAAGLPRGWNVDPRVTDICSVSTCLAKRPKGWVDRWDFNGSGYYSTPDAALAASPTEGSDGLHLFAYEFFPLRFDLGGSVSAVDSVRIMGGALIPPPDAAVLSGFEFLGYDAVERWAEEGSGDPASSYLGGGFGCSPLSCNACAPEHPVNRFCLLTEWADTVATALRFAKDQPEPGCYYIFGVWRKEGEPSGPHAESATPSVV